MEVLAQAADLEAANDLKEEAIKELIHDRLEVVFVPHLTAAWLILADLIASRRSPPNSPNSVCSSHALSLPLLQHDFLPLPRSMTS